MKPTLQFRLSQHLALTPQLQQSIRLLQLSTLELHQEVEQMLESNPFLETDDEYFDCSGSHHLQGFWRIYGIFLPKDVLAKVYYKNAERILGVRLRGRGLEE